MTSPLLEIDRLVAGYGAAKVLHEFSLIVGSGECVSLLGRNGMGKTTAICTVMGLISPWSGAIRISGADVTGQPSHRIARAGLGLVPEGRQTFANLTVDEHLVAFCRPGAGERWSPGRLYDLFPPLAARRTHRSSQLSGGEQQMLAIARALVTNPRLLILDEATEGLAPILRDRIWEVLQQLKDRGEAILIVDKNLAALGRLADRHAIVVKGQIVWQGNRDQLAADRETVSKHLAV